MAITLKDKEADRLAREVAAMTGESVVDAIRNALAERLERERLRRAALEGLAALTAPSIAGSWLTRR
jgi:antitoxin VapB